MSAAWRSSSRRDGYAGDFFEDFKQLIDSRLHLAPILISKLEKTPLDIDNPSWVVDDQFEIDRHIFRASLPAPADRATLARTVGWMHAKLLNRARPLWEFYVFEGLKDGEIGLYSKVHHACIDGGAGAALTEIVYDVSPTPREIPKAGAAKAAKNDFREVATTFLESYVELWRRPTDLGGLIKPIDLPRTGKSDLGSILFDNAMGQIEQTMRVLSGLPSIAKTMNEIVAKALDPKSRESLASMIAPSTPLNRSISSERSFAGRDDFASPREGAREGRARKTQRRRDGDFERRAAPPSRLAKAPCRCVRSPRRCRFRCASKAIRPPTIRCSAWSARSRATSKTRRSACSRSSPNPRKPRR